MQSRLDVSTLLPSYEELREPGKVTELIDSAGTMRQGISDRSHKSLCLELAMCVHAALFIVINDEWTSFCEWAELDATDIPKDVNVLYAVLLHYAGYNTDGRKKASRYKRALSQLFKERVPAVEVYGKLANGGVDGLLKNPDGSGEKRRTKAPAMDLMKISKPGTYETTLPAGGSQRVLITSDDGGHYEITVATLDSKPRKRIKLHPK
jgi:hypothetical protein